MTIRHRHSAAARRKLATARKLLVEVMQDMQEQETGRNPQAQPPLNWVELAQAKWAIERAAGVRG